MGIEARCYGLFDTGEAHLKRCAALSVTRFRTEAKGIVVQFAKDYSSFEIVEGGPPLKLVRTGGTGHPALECLNVGLSSETLRSRHLVR